MVDYVFIKVNCRDGRGVMSECYSGTYTGGVAPCRWNGSPAILQRFHRSQQPVRYADMQWVYRIFERDKQDSSSQCTADVMLS